MIETIAIQPGVTLRCFRDTRFKQGRLSFQFVRLMDASEAHLNALLPDVMLRATCDHPDIRAISNHMKDLYGAAVGGVTSRVGDYQTCGFGISFLEDRFALPGERVLPGVLDFLDELLNRPLLDGEAFLPEIVEGEKKNLIATIESELNNKANYAMIRLLRSMCREDSFGLSRLGEKEDVAKVTAPALYEHYLRVRRESPIEVFYVGTAQAEEVARRIGTLLSGWDRSCEKLPAQTPFRMCPGGEVEERMPISQGRLCLGFTTPITNRSPEFPAMQVCNALFGGGMTSKLFQNVREKLSLCYSVGSGYYGSKGILTVSAGIDFDKEALTRQEILRQLEACGRGDITQAELAAAKESICSGLRSLHDRPGSIEDYYGSAALSGMGLTAAEYMEAVRGLTVEQVAAAARTITYHTGLFLKGVDA